MTLTILGCVLLALSLAGAGVFSSLADLSSEGKLMNYGRPVHLIEDLFGQDSKEFKRYVWWNKDYSWENKDTVKMWILPRWSIRTIFVFLTDGWHLLNWCCNRCWQASVAIFSPYPITTYFFVWILFSAGKEITRKFDK